MQIKIKYIQELYEKWSGENIHINDCHPVHDSTGTIEFAEYCFNEILKNEIDLCNTCKKSNICNPHINYGINAISCKKYIKRKGIK